MLRKFVTASLLSALAAPAAHADLSYSYLRGGAYLVEADTALGEQDGQGFEAFGSYEVLRFLHVFAGLSQSELDELPVEHDLSQIGAGVHYDVSPTRSLYFNVSAISAEVDGTLGGLGTFGTDDDGFGYALGYREGSPNGRLEFHISAEHMELDDTDASDTWLDMSLQIRVLERFRVETAVQFAGEDNSARIGVRYYLPNRFDRRD